MARLADRTFAGRQTAAGGAGLALLLGFAAGLLSLLAFTLLADDVMDQATQQLDDAVLGWLQRFHSPGLDIVARIVSALGSEAVAALLIVLLVAFSWRGRWGGAAGLLLAVVGSQILNNLPKDLFQRTRPAPVVGYIPAQAFSFPSGHAMVSAAFYLYLGYLCWRLPRGWPRLLCAAGLCLLVLLIGLSRLYLGVHYLTDVVAGYIAGFAWTDAVIVGGHLLGRGTAPRLAARCPKRCAVAWALPRDAQRPNSPR